MIKRLTMQPPMQHLLTLFLLLGGLLFYIAGWLPLPNLVMLTAFAVAVYLLASAEVLGKLTAAALWLVALVLGLSAAIYRPGEFSYPLVWEFGPLHEGGSAFALFANISKAIGGYIVVVWLLRRHGAKKRPLMQSLMAAALAIGVVIVIARYAFHVDPEAKMPAGFVYFLLVNLFITVLSEEAFFRLLVQDHIAQCFSNRAVGVVASIAAATLLFALSHASAFDDTFLLFAVAGLVYSGVYRFTGRFSIAVLVHFGVNVVHFFLLEYPL